MPRSRATGLRARPPAGPRRVRGALALLAAASVPLATAGAETRAPLPTAGAETRVPLPPQPTGVPWPTATWPEAAPGADVDAAQLAAALDAAFAPDADPRAEHRAVVVVHRGRLVAERYAPGFDRESRFHSWSMAKSVTHALVGILVREGRLALDGPAPVPRWRRPGDPRGVLTLRNMLHMNTGLDADDDMQDIARSRVLWMMFGGAAGDVAAFAARAPLAHPPGTRWAYSTATSMLLGAAVTREAGGSREAALAFMRRELFEPVGLHSMEPEFDAAGTFLGGGFVWANARDWARFGLLYLRDGIWGDGTGAPRRILPAGWVDLARTAAPAANNTVFGAHFWRNVDPAEGQFPRLAPGAPASMFSAQGAYGQLVLIVPTHDLVVVRLGELQTFGFEPLRPLVEGVIGAFPPVTR